MWKLKIAEGGPLLRSRNKHIGREVWEFDQELGTIEERKAVEEAREEFKRNRFHKRQCSDLLMKMQFVREKSNDIKPAQAKAEGTIDHVTEDAATAALRKGIGFFSTIQAHDGHWPGDFPGTIFFTPILIIGLHVVGELNSVLSGEHQREVRRYLYNQQNKDGGWGFHNEGESVMFSTGLSYVALRLLDEAADGGENGAMERAQSWILDHGGISAIPSWGKVWLSVLGVYEWSGVNPIPPELYLLPSSLTFYPGKFLCHFRLIYHAMSYLYVKKFVGPITKTILSLRKEVYNQPYQTMNWNQARKLCAKEDQYCPHPLVQDIIWDSLYWIGEHLTKLWPFSSFREKALQAAMQHIHYEDEVSSFICLGAPEKVLDMICCYVEDPGSNAFKMHLLRTHDYLWVAGWDENEGKSVGSQTWEAAFACQAILSSELAKGYETTLMRAHEYLKSSQIPENPSRDFSQWHRHISKGGWAFATGDQGWQVSDCTAEALKVALLFSRISHNIVGEPLATECVYDAVNLLLSLQNNRDGGFSAWEPLRTYAFLEALNPTDFFDNCVLEHQYVECTSSAIQALSLFKELYPEHRLKEIERCIAKATRFIETVQENDGSWYGYWGVRYTYGTWFAIEGLVASGFNYQSSSSIRKACTFLLSKQLDSGGWGESYLSFKDKVYTNLPGNQSHVVNTAWAMLALMKAGQAERNAEPLHRAARYLISVQLQDGDFPQQEMVGAYHGLGVLNYPTYKNSFPIWALSEYRKQVQLYNSKKLLNNLFYHGKMYGIGIIYKIVKNKVAHHDVA